MTSAVAAARSALDVARAFYCDALGGRQVRRTNVRDDSGMLCFAVGGEFVTTGPAATDGRITIVVDDAVAIAERCWDAGFTVRVRDVADATTIVVIDPFDVELELVSGNNR